MAAPNKYFEQSTNGERSQYKKAKEYSPQVMSETSQYKQAKRYEGSFESSPQAFSERSQYKHANRYSGPVESSRQDFSETSQYKKAQKYSRRRELLSCCGMPLPSSKYKSTVNTPTPYYDGLGSQEAWNKKAEAYPTISQIEYMKQRQHQTPKSTAEFSKLQKNYVNLMAYKAQSGDLTASQTPPSRKGQEMESASSSESFKFKLVHDLENENMFNDLSKMGTALVLFYRTNPPMTEDLNKLKQTFKQKLRGSYHGWSTMPLFQKDKIIDSWISLEPDEGEPGTCSDFFDGSSYVNKLNNQNFREFVTQKDVVMVMFYDPRDKLSFHSKKHVVMAASATFRQNHAYAGVNCVKESELCAREQVTSLPLFKIYSKGRMVSTMKDYSTLTAQVMMKHVENCPLSDPTPPKRPGL